MDKAKKLDCFVADMPEIKSLEQQLNDALNAAEDAAQLNHPDASEDIQERAGTAALQARDAAKQLDAAVDSHQQLVNKTASERLNLAEILASLSLRINYVESKMRVVPVGYSRVAVCESWLRQSDSDRVDEAE